MGSKQTEHMAHALPETIPHYMEHRQTVLQNPVHPPCPPSQLGPTSRSDSHIPLTLLGYPVYLDPLPLPWHPQQPTCCQQCIAGDLQRHPTLL